MIQVSHGDDLNLDPPISSQAKKIVNETFNFKNILDYDISLVFVSDDSTKTLVTAPVPPFNTLTL